MTKCLNVELKTLFSKFWTWCIMSVMIVMAIENAITLKVNGDSLGGISGNVLFILICISAWAGFYISNDYTQNTIRNKISVGNSRLHIYLSKQLTTTIFFLVCIITYITFTLISNIIINNTIINQTNIIINIVIIFFELIAIAAFTTLISMSIKREAGGLVPLLLMLLIVILLLSLYELFNPETIKIIHEIIPWGTLLSLQYLDVTTNIVVNSKVINDIILTVFYSIVFTSVSTIVGYIGFKYSDLK